METLTSSEFYKCQFGIRSFLHPENTVKNGCGQYSKGRQSDRISEVLISDMIAWKYN